MSGFKFDENAFKREIGKQVDDAMKGMARDLTREMDALRATYEGRPLEEIKRALQALYRRRDGEITDPELTDYAEMIQAGTRITFTPGKVQW